MEITKLVRRARSCRRFDQSKPIPADLVRRLVDTARLCPSTQNAQPLKYAVSTAPEINAQIFSTLSWAGALTDWPGPAENERPTGYVVVLLDTAISENAGVDPGIAGTAIQLAATEAGYGACMVGSIVRPRLREILELPESLRIELAIALGAPAETIVLDEPRPDGSVVYYRDENDTHHVPKRRLEEVLVGDWR